VKSWRVQIVLMQMKAKCQKLRFISGNWYVLDSNATSFTYPIPLNYITCPAPPRPTAQPKHACFFPFSIFLFILILRDDASYFFSSLLHFHFYVQRTSPCSFCCWFNMYLSSLPSLQKRKTSQLAAVIINIVPVEPRAGTSITVRNSHSMSSTYWQVIGINVLNFFIF